MEIIENALIYKKMILSKRKTWTEIVLYENIFYEKLDNQTSLKQTNNLVV